MRFWMWFFRGIGDESGLGSYWNRWLIVQVLLGVALTAGSPLELDEAASRVFLPLVGILIGLSFAWGGSANALLQSQEIGELTDHVENGLESYIYVFQAAILSLFVTLCLWGLAALGWFDEIWPTGNREVAYFAVETVIYSVTAIALRECWHVVLGVQALLIGKIKLQRAKSRK